MHGEAQKRGGNCPRSHSRKSQSSLEFCLPNPYPDSPRLRPCGRPVSEGSVPHTRLTPLLHKSQGLGWASWESTADSASWDPYLSCLQCWGSWIGPPGREWSGGRLHIWGFQESTGGHRGDHQLCALSSPITRFFHHDPCLRRHPFLL